MSAVQRQAVAVREREGALAEQAQQVGCSQREQLPRHGRQQQRHALRRDPVQAAAAAVLRTLHTQKVQCSAIRAHALH